MNQYEMTFKVGSVTDEQLAAAESAFDAMLSHGHGSGNLLSVVVDGATGRLAGKIAIGRLRAMGVEVLAVHPDLVNASTIAKRAGVTRQAVSLWVSGNRRTATPFPNAFAAIAGGVWRWQEVNSWLLDNDLRGDTDVHYLTREEEVALDYQLMVHEKAARHPEWIPQVAPAVNVTTRASRVDIAVSTYQKIELREFGEELVP